MKLDLILAIQFLTSCLPAHAYDNENGAVMICDTQKQVERYVQIFDGNARAAILAVNTEENDPNACALTDISYVRGPEIGIARSSSHAFRIVPIVVIGVNTSNGFALVRPALFFTPIQIKELAV
jgi:hypothetical protein